MAPRRLRLPLLSALLCALLLWPSSSWSGPRYARYTAQGRAPLSRSWSPQVRQIALTHAFRKALVASFQASLSLPQRACLAPLLEYIQKNHPADFIARFRILSQETTPASLLLLLEIHLHEPALYRFLRNLARLWQDQRRLSSSCLLPNPTESPHGRRSEN